MTGIFWLLLGWLLLVALWQLYKPLPAGLDRVSAPCRVAADQVEFLADVTFLTAAGDRRREARIFPAVFALIDQARHYLLVDMFLFNDFVRPGTTPAMPLARELTARLVRQRRRHPGLRVDFITDPINTVYGGARLPLLDELRAAGINVIITDLRPLRDSNPLYSCLWRTFFQWWGNSPAGGWLPHPFAGPGRVGLRSYLALLNFKANHRKVFLADDGRGGMVSLVSSANPHGASAAHGNVALLVRGDFWRELYASEAAVAAFSGGRLQPVPPTAAVRPPAADAPLEVRLLTEKRIKAAVRRQLAAVGKGDRVQLAMFYLADREIIAALLAAGCRGAAVQLILDPNRDAFGYRKNGIPNRPVAAELMRRRRGRFEIRWYDTHGEQFHSKMVLIQRQNGPMTVILGSANLTRRNLDDFNLETDVMVSGAAGLPAMQAAAAYFARLWHNAGGGRYTVPYRRLAEDSSWKILVYRVQEALGLGTF